MSAFGDFALSLSRRRRQNAEKSTDRNPSAISAVFSKRSIEIKRFIRNFVELFHILSWMFLWRTEFILHESFGYV